mmetsp:Transcript_87149/g.259986  ORF Transcript_87149/g.259986 Transcript_87149/m.259986 type:complete len:207 (+) Transcript_87149:488-1108(+)
MRVDLHVEKWHLADGGSEELGGDRAAQHVADQQPAVGAADDCELRRRGDLAVDEVPRHSLDVLVRLVTLRLQGGLVPLRPVLAPTADVGDHLDAALLQPAHAHAARVARRQGDLKPAVRVEQRRRGAVQGNLRPPHHKVGHLGAIEAGREVLLDDEPRGVEHGRLRLDLFGAGAAVGRVAELERVGHEEPVAPKPELVVGVGHPVH